MLAVAVLALSPAPTLATTYHDVTEGQQITLDVGETTVSGTLSLSCPTGQLYPSGNFLYHCSAGSSGPKSMSVGFVNSTGLEITAISVTITNVANTSTFTPLLNFMLSQDGLSPVQMAPTLPQPPLPYPTLPIRTEFSLYAAIASQYAGRQVDELSFDFVYTLQVGPVGTVPLPAGALLLGSVLPLLGWMRSRRLHG